MHARLPLLVAIVGVALHLGALSAYAAAPQIVATAPA
jgi:hypothetical protein